MEKIFDCKFIFIHVDNQASYCHVTPPTHRFSHSSRRMTFDYPADPQHAVPLGEGTPTKEELLVHYPSKFTWEQLRTFVNSG
jgi:hypothetical protein